MSCCRLVVSGMGWDGPYIASAALPSLFSFPLGGFIKHQTWATHQMLAVVSADGGSTSASPLLGTQYLDWELMETVTSNKHRTQG